MGASTILPCTYFYIVPTSHPLTVLAAYGPGTRPATSTTFNRRPSQPRTSSWRQSLATEPHLRHPVVSCSGLDTASFPPLAVPVALEPRRAPSTSWPRTSHRRPPSFSAVCHATSVHPPERHLHRTANRSISHSVGTYIH